MVSLPPNVRWDVIQSLQEKAQYLNPGSQNFERYDKAISLALNPGRKVDQYLERNVLRDARRTLSRENREMPFSVLSGGNKGGDDSPQFSAEKMEEGRNHLMPGQRMMAIELVGQIVQAASQIKNGLDCLEGLISLETTQETADRLGITLHQVNYAKDKIREATSEIIGGRGDE